jgi:hypothetical protein
VKNVSCILEIVINSCMAIILGVNKKSWVTWLILFLLGGNVWIIWWIIYVSLWRNFRGLKLIYRFWYVMCVLMWNVVVDCVIYKGICVFFSIPVRISSCLTGIRLCEVYSGHITARNRIKILCGNKRSLYNALWYLVLITI